MQIQYSLVATGMYPAIQSQYSIRKKPEQAK